MLALHAWNLMGGLEWPALPFVIELLGVEDVEALVVDLVAVREWRRAQDQLETEKT